MLDLALIKAIRCMGTEKTIAKALGVTRQNINYWKNHALSIPYRHVLEIERLTKGAVTRYELAPHEKKLNKYVSTEFLPSIEDRLRLAMRIEEEVFKITHITKGAMDKICFRRHKKIKLQRSIANYAGFNSVSDYLQLKIVMLNGIPDLLNAVSDGSLSVYYAFIIAKFPVEMQLKILTLGGLDKL